MLCADVNGQYNTNDSLIILAMGIIVTEDRLIQGMSSANMFKGLGGFISPNVSSCSM